MRRQDSNLRPPGYEHICSNVKKRRKPRENRPGFWFLPTIRRRTAQNKPRPICRQQPLAIPFFPSPGEIPHCPNSITGEFRPLSWRHKDQQGRRCLRKFPISPSTFGTQKDGRNTTVLLRCPSFFPGWENGLLEQQDCLSLASQFPRVWIC